MNWIKTHCLLFACLPVLLLSACTECPTPRENRVLVFLQPTDTAALKALPKEVNKWVGKELFSHYPCEPCLAGRVKVVQVQGNCKPRALLSLQFPPLSTRIDRNRLPSVYTNFMEGLKAFQLDSLDEEAPASCFYPLFCQELTEMIEGVRAGKLQVLVYSDLLGKESAFGIEKSDQKVMAPDSMELQLIKRYKKVLPDLHDVAIQIVSNQKDVDELHLNSNWKLWKAIFERHGAQVMGRP